MLNSSTPLFISDLSYDSISFGGSCWFPDDYGKAGQIGPMHYQKMNFFNFGVKKQFVQTQAVKILHQCLCFDCE